ncbi:MAG: NADH-quinone oxidoreductase subunit C [Acidobacteriia bacterium]|nr:NADH-quinone oxidoreductase subunit C [Terriglobia bacterium]
MDDPKPGAAAPATPPSGGDATPVAPKKTDGGAAPKLDAAVPSRSLERLKEILPDAVEEVSFHCGVPIVRVRPERILDVCRFLKDDPDCGMTFLADLCGVDMIRLRPGGPRFDAVYHLFSIEHRERLTVKAAVVEDGEVASVTEVWRGANWHEREAFDMLGIRFAGHPDPRRILMPEDFDAHPLRKDFPLEGREKDHGYWRRPDDGQGRTYRES